MTSAMTKLWSLGDCAKT